jgi:hypothetical protein
MGKPEPATEEIFCSKNVGDILGMELRTPESTVVDMVHGMLKVRSATPKRHIHTGGHAAGGRELR